MRSPHRLLDPPTPTGDSMQRSAGMAALLFSHVPERTNRRPCSLSGCRLGKAGEGVPIEQAPDKLPKGACDERQRLLVALVAPRDLLQPAPCAKLRLADFFASPL